MAKILMNEGEPPLEGTNGGDTFQVSNGRLLVRQKVSPLQPSTIAKRAEVNGVVRGAKAFGNGLSTAQQAAMFFAAGEGGGGIGEIIGIYSSIYEGDVPELPTEILTADAGTVTIGSPVVCPATGSISAALTLADGPGDASGWLALSRPMSPGRLPRPEDCRVVAKGFSFPVILDVGSAYLSRFGFIPAAGSMLFLGRAVSASSGTASTIAAAVATIGCGGTCDAEVVPDVIVALSGQFAEVFFGMSCEGAGGMDMWSADIDSGLVTWNIAPPTGFNGTQTMAELNAPLTPGLYPFSIRFTMPGQTDVVVPGTFEVQGM